MERQGKGYLLSGPSQQGKSTCCSRLPPPWTVLCDEQALVLRGEGGKFLAHPLPTWNNFLGKGDRRSWGGGAGGSTGRDLLPEQGSR